MQKPVLMSHGNAIQALFLAVGELNSPRILKGKMAYDQINAPAQRMIKNSGCLALTVRFWRCKCTQPTRPATTRLANAINT